MKHLKKFNEELKEETYDRAARKLRKLGQHDRAKSLWDFSHSRKWKKRLEEYSKYGILDLNIENPKNKKSIVGKFALDISFDSFAFEDCLQGDRAEGDKDINLCLFVGIIPIDEEVKKLCDDTMPCADFDNGFFWGFVIIITFDIIDSKVIFTKFEIDNYDDSLSGNVTLANRQSAGKLKSLLKDIFMNKEKNYPASSDAVDMYSDLESSILISGGLSSECGLSLEDIGRYINTVSPNELLAKKVR